MHSISSRPECRATQQIFAQAKGTLLLNDGIISEKFGRNTRSFISSPSGWFCCASPDLLPFFSLSLSRSLAPPPTCFLYPLPPSLSPLIMNENFGKCREQEGHTGTNSLQPPLFFHPRRADSASSTFSFPGLSRSATSPPLAARPPLAAPVGGFRGKTRFPPGKPHYRKV